LFIYFKVFDVFFPRVRQFPIKDNFQYTISDDDSSRIIAPFRIAWEMVAFDVVALLAHVDGIGIVRITTFV